MEKFLRGVIFTGIFLVPFIPFVVTPSLLFPFITGKAFVFRVIVEVIFVAWLILALRHQNYRPHVSKILLALGVFLIVVSLADVLAPNSYKAFWSNYERMEGLITILHLCAYFLVLSSFVHKESTWKNLLATNVGASVLMCIFSLFQLAGKVPINQGGVRVDGRLGNATYLAVYLLICFFFSLYLFVQSRNHRTQLWWFLPVAALQIYILYYTATRGAILGLIGGLLITTVLVIWREREDKFVRRVAMGGLVATIVLVAGFVLFRNSDFVMESAVLARFSSLSLSEIKTQGRYFIWPMAWKGIKERPVFGWGQEGFNFVFNKYYDPRLYAQEQWFDRAHSTPIDWFVAGGVFAFLFYLGLYALALFYIWKSDSELSFRARSVLTGLLVGYLFHNIFVFDNLVSYILFFTILAYVHFHVSSHKERSFPNVSVSVQWRSVFASIIIIALGFSIYYANVRPWLAGKSLISALRVFNENTSDKEEKSLNLFKRALAYETFGSTEIREQLINSAEQFLRSGTSEEFKKSYIELTLTELSKQIEDTPSDTRYYVFQGLFLSRVGLFDQALETYKKANELSPGKQMILHESAAIYIAKGDFTKALELFKQALDLEPSYLGARVLYAIGAFYADDLTLADEILSWRPEDEKVAQAFQNAVVFDDRLLEVLIKKRHYDRALPILVLRVEIRPEDKDSHISLAAVYLTLGQRDKAVEVLEKMKERLPETKEEADFFISEIKAGRNP